MKGHQDSGFVFESEIRGEPLSDSLSFPCESAGEAAWGVGREVRCSGYKRTKKGLEQSDGRMEADLGALEGGGPERAGTGACVSPPFFLQLSAQVGTGGSKLQPEMGF